LGREITLRMYVSVSHSALESDCDKDVGCKPGETCVLHHAQCVQQPCYPAPKCLKLEIPATGKPQPIEAADAIPLANSSTPLVSPGLNDTTRRLCGKRTCKLNEYCAKVTVPECTFRESDACKFSKQCIPKSKLNCFLSFDVRASYFILRSLSKCWTTCYLLEKIDPLYNEQIKVLVF
jgi:hypothetical protein